MKTRLAKKIMLAVGVAAALGALYINVMELRGTAVALGAWLSLAAFLSCWGYSEAPDNGKRGKGEGRTW